MPPIRYGIFCGLLMLSAAHVRAQETPTDPNATQTADVTFVKEVAFLSPDRAEKLDLYLPAKRAPETRSPGIVIIHGGGWTGGDKGASREINIVTTLAKAGYVCVSVNYRLTGDRWPTSLYDCKNAVRFLRKNADKYQVDTAHIGVIGGSAGGHLALMVGLTTSVPELSPTEPYPGISDRVSAVVDMYGISNLATRRETDASGTPTVLAKPSTVLGSDPGIAKRASPVTYITKDSPPILILHGTKDTTVDRQQSLELAEKLEQKGVEHRLVLIEGIGHTFDLQTWRRKPLPYDLRPLVVAFFDKHLKPTTNGTGSKDKTGKPL